MKVLRYSSNRIESLTDGIFGFAMTLLVVNLDVPVLRGAVTNQELLTNLWSLSDTFFTFLLSFFLLASAWGVHQRQFAYIKQSDNTLMWINMVRLLFTVMVPFTTVLISKYDNLSAAAFIFSMNMDV